MFIFDQFKKDDRPLLILSICVLVGMGVLLVGLWRVQIVSNKRFEDNLQNQAFKTIRLPANRGKILDRNGDVLADNRGRKDVNLYLEELPDQFAAEYTNVVRKEYLSLHPGTKKIPYTVGLGLKREARYRVVSNITYTVSSLLKTPRVLDPKVFLNHYTQNPFVPFPIVTNLNARQVAIYSEQLANQSYMDLRIQPVRSYPNGSAAAHLLGFVRRHDIPDEDEDDSAVQFKYFLPDFEGQTGVEGAFDASLHGTAGIKRVLVNNVGYRQREKDLIDPAEPGQNIYLTIDLKLQIAAEKALTRAGAGTEGAAIVMDIHNGDILAMASSPTYDPNIWINPVTSEEFNRLNGDKKNMFNRATFGAYPPGSTFKIITGIACLESGLDPKESFHSLGEFRLSPTARPIDDTAPIGDYDFDKAFYKSSNTYFIHFGIQAGLRKLLEVGKRFHLGERTDIATKAEVAGSFPTPDEAVGVWPDSRTCNACIGQEITVTPLQMAVLTSAIANGGTLYWPRIVSHLRSQDTGVEEPLFSQGRVREQIKLNPKHLDIIHHAMLLDTEQPGASAYEAFHNPPLNTMRVGGKTGTAQITFPVKDHVTWFVSYAPFENPRYAVVVMVQHGSAGGKNCAPVARDIYEALEKREVGKAGISFLDRSADFQSASTSPIEVQATSCADLSPNSIRQTPLNLNVSHRIAVGGLEIRDTADWKSALQHGLGTFNAETFAKN